MEERKTSGGAGESKGVELVDKAREIDTAAPASRATESTRLERLQRARTANSSGDGSQHRPAATMAVMPPAPNVRNVCIDGRGVPTTAEELARWTPICGCNVCAMRAQRKWLASVSKASAGLEEEPDQPGPEEPTPVRSDASLLVVPMAALEPKRRRLSGTPPPSVWVRVIGRRSRRSLGASDAGLGV